MLPGVWILLAGTDVDWNDDEPGITWIPRPADVTGEAPVEEPTLEERLWRVGVLIMGVNERPWMRAQISSADDENIKRVEGSCAGMCASECDTNVWLAEMPPVRG